MKNIKKYLRLRNYLERLKWVRLFADIDKSTYNSSLNLHCSSKIRNSTIKDNVTIDKDVTIKECTIGNECRIMPGSYFIKTEIGDYSYVNMHSFILRAELGKFCSIGSHVYIGPGTHPMNSVTTHPFTFLKDYGNIINADDEKIVNQREAQTVIIGNDVWMGQGAIVMDNITIGDGAIVGAHSVVTKDVESYSVVVGNPAKVIKYRFDEETIKKLSLIKWWNWDKDRIKNNIDLFNDPVKFANNIGKV